MGRRLNRAIIWFFAGMLIVHGFALWSVRGMIRDGYPDFTALYGAGKMVLDGHRFQLYDPVAQWNAQQEFAARVRIRKGPLPYLRPPFEALLFAPLALLSYPSAYILWAGINAMAAMMTTLLLRRHVQVLQRFSLWQIALLPLAFTPVFLSIMQGQDSILLLFFYALAYLAVRNGQDFAAGCWLGLAVFKPHLVAPFILIALLQRRVKIVFGFTSVALALILVSVWTVGWNEFIRYPGYLWFLEQHTGRGLVLPRDTPNLRGLVEGVLSPIVPARGIFLLIGLLSAGVILFASRHMERANNVRTTALAFSLSLVATFLVSYHAFAYDLSVLLLPMLLLLDVKSGGREKAWLYGPIAFLFFSPIYPLLWLRFHAMNLVAVVLLLWMWGMSRPMRLPSEPLSRTAPA